MSQADFYQESQKQQTQTAKAKKYCRQCWREDFHFEVIDSPVVFGFLLVATFGLFLLVRPTRCTCCGTMRVF